ncbi:MAG: hypothetical protein M1833_004431 [Piccolia ochrophora]|nr:MAG: hypothetical protein M1833_004431 [Piccolia ochrophora]
MDVAHAPPSDLTATSFPNGQRNELDNGDMDIDMDVNLHVDDDAIVLDIEHSASSEQASKTASLNAGLLETSGPTPHKVHVRGLDNLRSSDIYAFATEHFPSVQATRLEWIDDTSANIVYDNPANAMKALNSFSIPSREESGLPPLQPRPAKTAPTRPEARLEVRLAIIEDRKRPGARERSRFYLFNPDEDPGERRRREGHERRNSGISGASGGTARERRSREGDQDTQVHREAGKDLFPDLINKDRGRRLRDRSASPERDQREGDVDMTSNRTRSRSRRFRHRDYAGPSRNREAIESPSHTSNNQELFPTKVTDGKDPGTPTTTRELFPQKTNAHHRRSAAFDAADETADLFAGRMAVPFTDGGAEQKRVSGSLADRLSRADAEDAGGDDEAGPVAYRRADGFSIRGAAQEQNRGFSIRGAGAGNAPGLLASELFPEKLGVNVGKELFVGKLQGRVAGRRRAEDMFY